jgi:hypothetical protein
MKEWLWTTPPETPEQLHRRQLRNAELRVNELRGELASALRNLADLLADRQ